MSAPGGGLAFFNRFEGRGGEGYTTTDKKLAVRQNTGKSEGVRIEPGVSQFLSAQPIPEHTNGHLYFILQLRKKKKSRRDGSRCKQHVSYTRQRQNSLPPSQKKALRQHRRRRQLQGSRARYALQSRRCSKRASGVGGSHG